jgi:hypothetical protein
MPIRPPGTPGGTPVGPPDRFGQSWVFVPHRKTAPGRFEEMQRQQSFWWSNSTASRRATARPVSPRRKPSGDVLLASDQGAQVRQDRLTAALSRRLETCEVPVPANSRQALVTFPHVEEPAAFVIEASGDIIVSLAGRTLTVPPRGLRSSRRKFVERAILDDHSRFAPFCVLAGVQDHDGKQRFWPIWRTSGELIEPSLQPPYCVFLALNDNGPAANTGSFTVRIHRCGIAGVSAGDARS